MNKPLVYSGSAILVPEDEADQFIWSDTPLDSPLLFTT